MLKFVMFIPRLAADLKELDEVEIAGTRYILGSIHSYRKENLTRLIFVSRALDTVDLLVNKNVPFTVIVESD